MRRKPLTWRLLPAFLVITLATLITVTWYTAKSWHQFYLRQLAEDLETRARLVGAQIQNSPILGEEPSIQVLCRDLGRLTATRLTLILSSGKVVGDSDEDPVRMDNHGDRPEFQEAMKGQVGTAIRFSFTLKHDMMYVAVPLKKQDQVAAVVRASLPMKAIDLALRALYWKIALGGLVIALVAGVLSLFISRRLSGPLEDLRRGARRFAQGDLSRPLPVPNTEELAILAEAMNFMAAQLEDKLQSLTRRGQEQEAVLSSMVEGVMAVDAEGTLLTLNLAGAKMLGVDPAAVQNQKIQEVVQDPGLQWFLTSTLSAREPVEGEVDLNGDGKRIFQAHGTSLRDAQGGILGTLIVFHDITHLRRLETARRDFVANVSHELKTPVTSIKGFVETLQAGALKEPENAEKFLKILSAQTNRLSEIIDDLLSLSRIEQDAERGQIFLTAQQVKGVLESAIQVCDSKAVAKGVAVQLSCPNDLRARLNVPLLEQALVNLIDNAIKFSESGQVVVVEAEKVGAEATIRVKDQGCGIPREHLSRIFERFYRVDAGRSRQAGGTGLGLAIVKHIAQAHGGRVSVESTPGKGSTFSIFLAAA